MKKILFLAMAAVALMACNGAGGAGVPASDKKAINAASGDAFAMVGKAKADVDKAFKNAGFTLVSTNNPAGMPSRFKAPAAKLAEPQMVVNIYGYNYPNVKTQEEFNAALDSLMGAGKSFAMAYTYFLNDTLILGQTAVQMPCMEGIGTNFAENSDKFFKVIDIKGAMNQSWQGGVFNDEEKEFTDGEHAAFTKFIVDNQKNGLEAQEQGAVILSRNGDGFEYLAYLFIPDEEDKEDQKQNVKNNFAYSEFLFGQYMYVELYLQQE